MIFRILLFLLVGSVLVFGFSRLFTELYSNSRLYLPAIVPSSRVAIVFGAGLSRDGSPSPVLKDRVTTAAELYFSGKIQKIFREKMKCDYCQNRQEKNKKINASQNFIGNFQFHSGKNQALNWKFLVLKYLNKKVLKQIFE